MVRRGLSKRMFPHAVTYYGQGEGHYNELNTYIPGEYGTLDGYEDREAFVDDLSSNEWYIAQQNGMDVVVNIYTTFEPPDVLDMQIKHNGHWYKPEGRPLNQGGRNRYWMQKCAKGSEPDGLSS